MSQALEGWRSGAVGIGIGVPGLVDRRRGVVLRVPALPFLDGFPLLDRAGELVEVRVDMDNDANVAGLAEAHFGSAQGAGLAVVLTIGTGIGGVMIEAGRLLRGHSGLAGEVGHMVVEPDGRGCECGGHGCLQTEVSAPAIVRRYREIAGETEAVLDAAEVSRRADSGDAAARAALAVCGRYRGMGLATLVNLLNPQTIVIGGGVVAAGDWLFGPAVEEAARRAWTEAWQDCDLVEARLGPMAGVVGAACLVRE